MKTLSATDAARMIGVSAATVRNWVKAGHVAPLPGDGLSFAESEILRLKNELTTGRLNKLRGRANKINSNAQFVPAEYADNATLIDAVKRLLALRKQTEWHHETPLFLAAIRFLETAGDVDLASHRSRRWFDGLAWRRHCVEREMRRWHDSLPQKPCEKTYAEIAAIFEAVDVNDDLGILRQALYREGDKSKTGSYYTPTKYVFDALRWAGIRPGETMLDPCCGTGKYLVAAVRHFGLRPEHCFGCDIDATAVRLARVHLFLAAPQGEFAPNIFRCDALTDTSIDRFGPFDLVATNPPWGAYQNANPPTVASGRFRESFALFLARSLSLLRENGKLSFLLPEAFLRIKTHAEIRRIVLTQTTVHSVTRLGRGFSGVFTGALRLDLVKAKPRPDHACRIVNHDGVETRTRQAVFHQNRDFVFDVDLDAKDRELLEKIFAIPHVTLKGYADWALGIVTGNNEKHVVETHDEGFEPILRGSDIEKYCLHEPDSFLRFNPACYQQVAPSHLYRAAEKLVYRFISTKPVFAYDDKGRLTLNSVNVLIPRLPGMSVKVTMAFLNSMLFQYVFEKKFATHKVLRSDLERLPFPVISRETHDAIESLVETFVSRAENKEDDALYRDVVQELEQRVFAAFPALTENDIFYITNACRKK